MGFELHPDLQRDSILLGHFRLCQVRLVNDSAYPWFVMIPERENICDTIDLSDEDYQSLWNESRVLARGIMSAFEGEKLNVAALGNVTPQLHLHHVVRFANDPAWPGPIWGKQPMTAYDDAGIIAVREKLESLKLDGFVGSPIVG